MKNQTKPVRKVAEILPVLPSFRYVTGGTLFDVAEAVSDCVRTGGEPVGPVVIRYEAGKVVGFIQGVQFGRLERDLARMLDRLPELFKAAMNLSSGRNFPTVNPPPVARARR